MSPVPPTPPALPFPTPDAGRLRAIVRATPWLMRALQAGRTAGVTDWCIGAGALRNAVWDHLHGHTLPSALADLDFAWFDASPQAEPDAVVQARLQALAPGLPWEVVNQARVHEWFEAQFGHAVEPLSSLQDAVATWPEYATAVAVTLRADGGLDLIAPHGLDDLLAMRVRHNPARASRDTFRHRVATKRYAERWPKVVIEGA